MGDWTGKRRRVERRESGREGRKGLRGCERSIRMKLLQETRVKEDAEESERERRKALRWRDGGRGNKEKTERKRDFLYSCFRFRIAVLHMLYAFICFTFKNRR